MLLISSFALITTGNWIFAECILSGTRQTSSLPSAAKKTLGKIITLGKKTVCRVLKKNTRQRSKFAECSQSDTRQTLLCRVLYLGHSRTAKVSVITSLLPASPLHPPVVHSKSPTVPPRFRAPRRLQEERRRVRATPMHPKLSRTAQSS